MSAKPPTTSAALSRVDSAADFTEILRLLIRAYDSRPADRGYVPLGEVSALLDGDGSCPFTADDARRGRFTSDRVRMALSYGDTRGWIEFQYGRSGYVRLTESTVRAIERERTAAEGWGDPDPFREDVTDADLRLAMI